MTTPRRKFSAAQIVSHPVGRDDSARRKCNARNNMSSQAFIFLPVQENEAKEHAKEGTQCLSPPWNHPRAEEGTALLLAGGGRYCPMRRINFTAQQAALRSQPPDPSALDAALPERSDT